MDPGERSLGERTRGIERTDKTEGIIIAYATTPGEVAVDGQDRNSPFTKAVLRRLNEPGLEIEMMFRRIAADLSAATGGRQRPETYMSLVSDYYLNQNDKIAWDAVRASGNPADLHDFIERFPSSFYAIEARYRLQALERAIAEAKERALRDADGLRRLAAEACDDVRAAAQKNASASSKPAGATAEPSLRSWRATLAPALAHADGVLSGREDGGRREKRGGRGRNRKGSRDLPARDRRNPGVCSGRRYGRTWRPPRARGVRRRWPGSPRRSARSQPRRRPRATATKRR